MADAILRAFALMVEGALIAVNVLVAAVMILVILAARGLI